jgi:hypothetical protein
VPSDKTQDLTALNRDLTEQNYDKLKTLPRIDLSHGSIWTPQICQFENESSSVLDSDMPLSAESFFDMECNINLLDPNEIKGEIDKVGLNIKVVALELQDQEIQSAASDLGSSENDLENIWITDR